MSHSSSSSPSTVSDAAATANAPTFKLISTLDPSHLRHWPNPSATSSPSSGHHILILDSSHNPPTAAHAHLVSTALASSPPTPPTPYTAVLLLLATRNADKGHLPSSSSSSSSSSAIHHRTHLMHLLATHLRPAMPTAVATIECALFADKARALQQYLRGKGQAPRLDWITGHDTLVRIMHPKYYPPPSTVRGVIVSGFLEPTRSRLLVAPRPEVDVPEGADLGLIEELEDRGLVVPLSGVDPSQVAGVSSSLVRDLRKRGDGEGWKVWVVPEVAEYIEREGLYV